MDEVLRNALVKTAEAHVAQWPQYKDHFVGYVLGRVKKTVKTKLGVAFTRGETVLVNPGSLEYGHDVRGNGHNYLTAWSVRNKIDTELRAEYVEAL